MKTTATILTAVLTTLIATVTLASAVETSHAHGWRGDGCGYFGPTAPTAPTAPAVVEWGGTGEDWKNILWETALPDFGRATPVIIGKQVFTTCEPYELYCLDTDSGKILWQKSNDQFGHIDDADRAERGRKLLAEEQAAWKGRWEWHEKVKAIMKDFTSKNREEKNAVAETMKKGTTLAAVVLADNPELRKTFEGLLAEGKAQGYVYSRSNSDLDRTGNAAHRERTITLAKDYNEWWEESTKEWPHITGRTFATPRWDDERLYASFANNVVAAFGIDGTRLWSVWDYQEPEQPRRKSDLPGKRDLFYAPSPVLTRKLLIVAGGKGRLRAYDKTSGEKRWEVDFTPVGKICGTPWSSPLRT